MKLTVQELDDRIIMMTIDGGLDSSNARVFGDRMQALVEAGHTRFILDATNLQTISSLGVAVLLRLHGQLKPTDGDLKLANLQGTVWDVISLFQLDKLFAIFPDVDAARIAFREPHQS